MTVKKTPTEVRNQRRQAAEDLPPEVKEVVSKLLPQSQQMMAMRIQKQSARVRALLAAPVQDTHAAALKARAVAEEAKKLAGLVAATKTQRLRRATGKAGTEEVDPVQVQARQAAVKNQLNAVHAELRDTIAMGQKANPATKAVLGTRAAVLAAQHVQLSKRLELLARGLDLERPVTVPATSVQVQRVPLKLPLTFDPPTQGEVIVILRLISSLLPSYAGETPKQYRQRLRAYTQRALVRTARAAKVAGRSRSDAVKLAVEETLQTDGPAIESEVAAGGIVVDPAAQAMDPFIDQSVDQLEAASEDVTPAVPEGDPTPRQVRQILAAADVEAAQAARAPRELADEINEDLVLPPMTEVPFYKQPRVIMAGIGAAVLLLLLGR